MRRLSILVVAILVGMAGPVRAWCEATCVAPAAESSHCPSHEPADDGPALTAAGTAECPAIETARPAVAKIEIGVQPPINREYAAHPAPQHVRTSALQHLRALGVFDTDIPLRI